jgi:hypothetical protein
MNFKRILYFCILHKVSDKKVTLRPGIGRHLNFGSSGSAKHCFLERMGGGGRGGDILCTQNCFRENVWIRPEAVY